MHNITKICLNLIFTILLKANFTITEILLSEAQNELYISDKDVENNQQKLLAVVLIKRGNEKLNQDSDFKESNDEVFKNNDGTQDNAKMEKFDGKSEKESTESSDEVITCPKDSLRWKGCNKKAAKVCFKACKKATLNVCSLYDCSRKTKRSLKVECKRSCEASFVD